MVSADLVLSMPSQETIKQIHLNTIYTINIV